jgi:hypothetical protein
MPPISATPARRRWPRREAASSPPGNSPWALDGVEERFGDCPWRWGQNRQTAVQTREARSAYGGRREIGGLLTGTPRWGSPQRAGGLMGRDASKSRDKERVHADQRRSICRRARAGRLWRAVFRLRPIFSSAADFRTASGAGVRDAEAGPQTTAAAQINAANRCGPAGEADGALRRPDICAGLGRAARGALYRIGGAY